MKRDFYKSGTNQLTGRHASAEGGGEGGGVGRAGRREALAHFCILRPRHLQSSAEHTRQH